MHGLARHAALSVSRAIRRGSSWPCVVRTEAGDFLTKLRGAAQGVLPLIAEIIVGELATALGLPVPERVVVSLDDDTPSEDRNDELADLLHRSAGANLGFRFLPGAVDLTLDRLSAVPEDVGATILWLDGLVMNPDRTPRNPNVLLWHRQPWLIDHGAALPFHYDLGALTEQTARETSFDWRGHLFEARAARAAELDAACAAKISRDVLANAASVVPDEFIATAFPGMGPATVRGMYTAVLWKRLKAPRAFLPL